MPGYSDAYFSHNNFVLVERLAKLAEETKLSMSELAIAWILRNRFIKSVLIGARTPEQIETACRADELLLSDKTYQVLESLGVSDDAGFAQKR